MGLFAIIVTQVDGDDPTPADSEQAQEASPTSVDQREGRFEDDFSAADGGRQVQVDGGDAVTEGDVRSKMFSFARLPVEVPGHLTLIMTEDNSTNGPDDKPGVLRMEIAEVPHAPSILGFVYQGNEASGEITMPAWEGSQISLNDLRRAFITFRFRADNREDPNSFGATFKFRFDPGIAMSRKFGADFGTLIATSRWRTFRRPLGSAENLRAFLEVVNGEKPKSYRLVWSQENIPSDNHAGDSLLIDDLEISIE
ncbi:MAG: hypothetical protein KDA52_18825 [Planctomycetaceae bacterium]|nr:hypothetical protein [Planctomycetaceae bacterium]